MTAIVEARGISYQEAALLAVHAIKKANEGEIVVLVDTGIAKEGISRAVTNQRWRVKRIESVGRSYSITISNEQQFSFSK
jgi:TusA-related sulfurtransferase